jgi:lycopene cyclase CruP
MSEHPSVFEKFPSGTLASLQRADQMWQALKENTRPLVEAVQESTTPLNTIEWDVVVSGGTLGIPIAAILAQKQWRVALIERGTVRGREQEWNISRSELQVLCELELLSPEELEDAIATEFNPVRISIRGGDDIWVRDILNVGVYPVTLIETCKQKFLQAGGQLLEEEPFAGATVHPDGVEVKTKTGNTLKTRLLLDSMGHFSPIASQARQGKKPDGICMVVGGCAQGFDENESGDLFASFTPILNQCQYFWEAFPARDGRTTYLFTYMDADPRRFSLSFFLEEYLRLLPEYQNVDLEQLQWQRLLFGFFPSYRQSPIRYPWSRIVPIGDSSSTQSPLSFGGFGAMVRHLKRLSEGIDEALRCDALRHGDLAELHPYQPSLSVTWLFQQAMSVDMDRTDIDPDAINRLLRCVFAEMDRLGEKVLNPFLQDVVQFQPLSAALLQTTIRHPQVVREVIPKLGIETLLDWSRHYLGLGAYSGLYLLAKQFQGAIAGLSPQQQYYFHRLLDAYCYGSGQDYDL